MNVTHLEPIFIEFIPEELEDGKLYVSEEYSTAVHKCCCGCGLKVVTPLKAKGWKLTRVGDTVTLYPSIGNWSFPCQSHYWIRRNHLQWSYQMTPEEIAACRRGDIGVKEQSRHPVAVPVVSKPTQPDSSSASTRKKGLWSRLWEFLWGTPR